MDSEMVIRVNKKTIYSFFIGFILGIFIFYVITNIFSINKNENNENIENKAVIGKQDLIIGNKDAKIKVIEYLSLECGACRHYHAEIYKNDTEKYVKDGKIAWIPRFLSLSKTQNGYELVKIAYCSIKLDKNLDFLITIFDNIFNISNIYSLYKNPEKLRECVNSKEVEDYIHFVEDRAIEDQIMFTPTFIIVDGNKINEKLVGVQYISRRLKI